MGMNFRGQVLKRVPDNYIFWAEIDSGFGEPCRTPPPTIPRSVFPRGVLVREKIGILFFSIEYAGHAEEMMMSLNLLHVDGIVICSGDGLVYEVIISFYLTFTGAFLKFNLLVKWCK